MAIDIGVSKPRLVERKADIAVAAVAAAVALGCGGVAALSLVAAFISLPADPVADGLRRGEAQTKDRIALAADASLRAGNLFEKGRYFSDAALELAALKAMGGTPPRGAPPLADLVDQALAAAPASPHNWARRAAIALAANDMDGARRSLETSLLLGRYVPGLTVPRLRTMFALMRRTPSALLESAFEEQVRIAARTEPLPLARFADGGAAEGRVQRILGSDFALYDRYLRSLMWIRADPSRAAKPAS